MTSSLLCVLVCGLERFSARVESLSGAVVRLAWPGRPLANSAVFSGCVMAGVERGWQRGRHNALLHTNVCANSLKEREQE